MSGDVGQVLRYLLHCRGVTGHRGCQVEMCDVNEFLSVFRDGKTNGCWEENIRIGVLEKPCCDLQDGSGLPKIDDCIEIILVESLPVAVDVRQ